MSAACKVCENSEANVIYVAREMMLGTREEFEYLQCSKCECLQLLSLPDGLDKYYPSDYYSFSEPRLSKQSMIRRFFQRQRTNYVLTKKGFIGRILCQTFGSPLPGWMSQISDLDLRSAILDVGCGNGKQLYWLGNAGFSDLTGFDPYIEKGCCYGNGVKVVKRGVAGASKCFDLIMLHHSFEHIPDPLLTLKQIHAKLACNGSVILRIPTVSSFAWRHYTTNWVQLDAPRHLFLHSLKSVEILANKAGFYLESCVYDSDSFQFWGSEQYLRGIALESERSYGKGLSSSIFTQDDITEFESRARELNAAKDGDQACFVLRKQKK